MPFFRNKKERGNTAWTVANVRAHSARSLTDSSTGNNSTPNSTPSAQGPSEEELKDELAAASSSSSLPAALTAGANTPPPPPPPPPVDLGEGYGGAPRLLASSIAHDTLNAKYWKEPEPGGFVIRAGNYLEDKVKYAAGKQVFKLIGVDLFEFETPQKDIVRSELLGNRLLQLNPPPPPPPPGAPPNPRPFTFIVTYMVPGPPYLSFVCYFSDPSGDQSGREALEADNAFGRLARKFFFGEGFSDMAGGSDCGGGDIASRITPEQAAALYKYRNNTFKMIPTVIDGPMAVRRGFGATPVLLGNKLTQTYTNGLVGVSSDGTGGVEYFELDIDIASSRIANATTAYAMRFSTSVVVDMAFLLEGKSTDELPEVLMGVVEVNQVDCTAFQSVGF